MKKKKETKIDFSDNNRKLMIILNSITTIFGIIAFILLFSCDVELENPITWIISILVLSSISSLATVITKSK